jgi:glycosyltransferase involved in cell wall biosynthesis
VVNDKNIVYIVSNFPCYSETFILNELVELKKRGYKIFIFSLKKPKEKIVQNEAREFLGDTTYCPALLKLGLLRAQINFLLTKPKVYLGLLAGIIRRCLRKPAVLLKNLIIFPKSVYFAFYIRPLGIKHAHAHFANYPTTSALIISKLLNITFSFTCHAHDIFYDTTMLDFKIKNSKACFAISGYNRDYILNLYPDLPEGKIKVLHCGINLEKFSFSTRNKTDNKLRILSIGRLMPTKGFDNLIKTCRILKDKGLDFICDIIGEGPMEKILKRLTKNLDLQSYVNFLGPLPHEKIIDYYQQADIFVLVSKKAKHRDVQDGIPVVLMEAIALGVSVISTRLSGIPELIEHNKTGLLVEPNDEVGLAEAIIKIYSSPDLSENLKRNAQDKVSLDFNIKKSIDQLEKIIIKNP